MKRLISLFLAFCLLVSCAPVYAEEPASETYEPISETANYSAAIESPDEYAGLAAAQSSSSSAATSGQCGDNVYWSLDEATGTLTISGSGDMWNFTGWYGNKPAPWADDLAWSILKIVIEDGVTSVGTYAFDRLFQEAVEILLPDTLTSIGAHAFLSAPVLEIALPNNLKVIGDYAFMSSDLKQIDIPEGVTSVGRGVFQQCDGLTRISIPASLSVVPNEIAYMCSNLLSVKLSYGISEISFAAFSQCTSLKNIDIPSSVTILGDSAFHSTGLESVNIPDSVIKIGVGTFSNCGSLESIHIPAGVTSIGAETAGAFESCASLKTITVSQDNEVYTAEDNVLLSKDKKTLFCVPGARTGAYEIPDHITKINRGAFSGCSLSSVIVPGSILEIPIGAFEYSEKLRTVTISEGIKTINNVAFQGCTTLESLYIPASVTYFGFGAISNCTNLTSIDVNQQNERYWSDGYSLFSNVYGSYGHGVQLTCFAPGITGVYKVPENVNYINDEAFRGSRLSGVVLPANLFSIENNAFMGCDSLNKVYYSGTREQWSNIEVGYGNDDLLHVEIICGENIEGLFNTGNGTDSSISALHIFSVSDGDVIIGGAGGNIIAVFNKDITVADTSKSISIWDAETGRMFVLFSVNNPHVSINKNVLSIDLSDFQLYTGRTYYVRMQSGGIKSTDGDIFFGVTDNTTWTFTMPRDLRVSGISYQWQENWFGKQDKSKPPVPDGTDEQYAQLLRNWAWSTGWEIEINDALELLDYPAYLPVTDVNNQPVLLNDNATTVRQVIEDIVFVSELQSYIDDLDNELEGIIPSTEAESAWGIIAEILGQEAEAYETAAGWYEQVDRYLSGRAEDSNFFLSLGAPIAYQVLTQTIGEAKVGTIGKAYLDTIVNETALQTVDGAEKYDEFKSTVQDIGNIGKGTAAAYTALMNGEANKVIKFSTNLLADYFAKSDNEMLSDIATAYKDLNKVIPAVKLCMFLGSTAGMFPMVIDLYNDLNRSRYDQVKAAYFIANYYIIEKDPELYDTIMSLDDGRIHSRSYVWEKFTEDAFDYQQALEAAEQSGDPIIENWARFINSGRIADVDEVDSSLLWRNIASYATILRFAKSINVNDTIVALIDYLQSEGQAPATTGISVSCPVRVNIYDMSGNLVASLSSEDDEIADCQYGTMYLLGENGETKCFLLSSENYKIEIVPYADGTMDVSITNSNEDGTASGVYYESVELRTGMTITTDSLVGTGSSLNVGEAGTSTTVAPEDEIPVMGISIDAPSELAIGESYSITAIVAPETATDKSLAWSSSNSGVIDVSGDGVITAVSAGNATITAMAANGISASVEVSAYSPAQSVSLDMSSLTMCVGEEYSLTVAVEPVNTTHPIKWYSSAGNVAFVDENGNVCAQSEGIAVITADVDGVSTSVTVTVSEEPISIILYQSDTNGDRIKVDMLNNSLYSSYTGSVFISLYDADGRMLSTSELPLALSAGTHMTGYIPITNWDGHSELTAKAVTIDGQMIPVNTASEIGIIR